MTKTHTPGPWEVSPRNPCRVVTEIGNYLHPLEPRRATKDEIDDDYIHDDWGICTTDNDYCSRPHDECVANANLIAAAPELLAALQRAFAAMLAAGPQDYQQDDPETNYDAAIDAARDAIAKAKGTTT